MIASKVASESDINTWLSENGYKKTDIPIPMGTIWRKESTGELKQIPSSIQGFYPDWLIERIEDVIEDSIDLPGIW